MALVRSLRVSLTLSLYYSTTNSPKAGVRGAATEPAAARDPQPHSSGCNVLRDRCLWAEVEASDDGVEGGLVGHQVRDTVWRHDYRHEVFDLHREGLGKQRTRSSTCTFIVLRRQLRCEEKLCVIVVFLIGVRPAPWGLGGFFIALSASSPVAARPDLILYSHPMLKVSAQHVSADDRHLRHRREAG